jgi:glycosyltransferase involved in cell wall biosynthesis
MALALPPIQELAKGEGLITDAQVLDAEELLKEILLSPDPAQTVAQRLEKIDALLPAIIELNLRRAKQDGRLDLVKGLHTILENICAQLESGTPPEPAGMIEWIGPAEFLPRVLFLGSLDEECAARQTLPAEALGQLGCEVSIAAQAPRDFHERFDVIVAHQPHADPVMMQGLAACAAASIPVVLDLTTDFEQLPMSHPRYTTQGLNTLTKAKAFSASLFLAGGISVATEMQARPLRDQGHRVSVIPDGWSCRNELWEKPASRRKTLHLGWVGGQGQLEDMIQIRRIVTRILHEFSQVNLVIAGDAQTYQLFDNLPEARRLYLPPVRLEDYPYLLGQIDILVAPLRSKPYNLSLPDRPLMEAGVRRIPWVASPIPAFVDWGAGGLIAREPVEWHHCLRQLILDPEMRADLGEAGRQKAESREMGKLGKTWLELVREVARGTMRDEGRRTDVCRFNSPEDNRSTNRRTTDEGRTTIDEGRWTAVVGGVGGGI